MAPEGRNSPSPERQSGAQLHDATGSGKATNTEEATKKWEEGKAGPTGVEGLSSNPKSLMDDVLKEKYGKSAK